MALIKRGRYYYGDTSEDLQHEMSRFSRLNEYICDQFLNVVCSCGNRLFSLYVDEDAGAAVRVCSNCKHQHAIGDSDDYLDEAELERCICVCDQESLELSVGVSLYSDSDDVKWIYIGCRCPECRIIGVYANWKCEYIDYRELFSKV